MNKLFANFLAFTTALVVVIGLFIISKDSILSYHTDLLRNSLQKTVSLQSDLESGKIVAFASSELVFYPNQRFLPQKFFNDELKQPLRVQGNEGQQTFTIMSQLAACFNEESKENARIAIFLSPSWFTGNGNNGTKIPKFLEFMPLGMMNKLYFESTIDDSFKLLISQYVQKNIKYIENPSFLYKQSYENIKEDYLDNYIKKFIIQNFNNKTNEVINYTTPKIDYKNLELEASNIEKLNSNNNIYGINSLYFSKVIQPEMNKGNFPFTITVESDLSKNQEYQDFLALLNLLSNYKIKPLFIIEDFHPDIYINNREKMENIIGAIKSKIEEYNYAYYDMWTYKKEDYRLGMLTDLVHLGEVGWVKLDQKIIEHFMAEKKVEK